MLVDFSRSSLRGTKTTERSELINTFKDNNTLIIPDRILTIQSVNRPKDTQYIAPLPMRVIARYEAISDRKVAI